MKKAVGTACMILGTLCVLAAMALLIFNKIEDGKAQKASEELMPQLENVIEETKNDEEKEPADVNPQQMPVVKVAEYEYVGYIEIPDLGLKLPVMSDWSYSKLRIAPCRYTGSTKTDDIVIAAHNYTRHFGRIKNLSRGSKVYFTDMSGIKSEYEVVELDVLNPMEVKDLTAGEFDLSLFTCNYSGQSRITVRCDRVY